MEAILDTNALIYAAKQKVDVYSLLHNQDYSLILLSSVVKELEELSTKAESGADKVAAKLALQIAKQKAKLVEVDKGDVDETLISYAKEHGAVILTNDYLLKKKARSVGVTSFSVSRSKLMR